MFPCCTGSQAWLKERVSSLKFLGLGSNLASSQYYLQTHYPHTMRGGFHNSVGTFGPWLIEGGRKLDFFSLLGLSFGSQTCCFVNFVTPTQYLKGVPSIYISSSRWNPDQNSRRHQYVPKEDTKLRNFKMTSSIYMFNIGKGENRTCRHWNSSEVSMWSPKE